MCYTLTKDSEGQSPPPSKHHSPAFMACPRVWLVPSTLAWLRNSTMFKHPAAAGPPSLLFPPPPASSSIRASQPRTTAWQWLMPCASSLGTRRSHAGLRRWKGERGSRRMVARSLQMGLMCSWCTCATNLCCASTSSCCCWFGLLLVQEELPERQPCCSSLRRVFTSASNSAVTSQAASRGRQMIGSLRTADGGVEQGALCVGGRATAKKGRSGEGSFVKPCPPLFSPVFQGRSSGRPATSLPPRQPQLDVPRTDLPRVHKDFDALRARGLHDGELHVQHGAAQRLVVQHHAQFTELLLLHASRCSWALGHRDDKVAWHALLHHGRPQVGQHCARIEQAPAATILQTASLLHPLFVFLHLIINDDSLYDQG
eukprot:1144446-Pelagomonas_calceolata.AAC.9